MKTRPIGLFGFIWGEKRYEGTGEWERPGGLLAQPPQSERYMPGGFVFWDKGLISPNGSLRMVLTHLQYKSPFGFLLSIRNKGFPWPTPHVWFFWHMKKQERVVAVTGSNQVLKMKLDFQGVVVRGEDGGPVYETVEEAVTSTYLKWIPGTEDGIYLRGPGWRWDFDLGMIWGAGYGGGNWD